MLLLYYNGSLNGAFGNMEKMDVILSSEGSCFIGI